ncbi:Asparagine--tRNA ligase [Frankliniella fusca]|uniref:Asparagine--tRNA ligase n=1 Tax=Frankliniella fusca TaxID=407009 RepID=A0AAE1LDZ3_9NEOP|nr:Asparagine--tRNA ligase [Frankliniella fusca]
MKTDEFVETLISQLKDLLPHHHISKAPSKYLSYVKENLKEGEVIVVSDFSENYSFIVQDSVQGFYWTNDQATVHPFVCYHKVNGKLETLSFIIVSDYMKHNISAVYAFQTKLVTFLREKVPNISKLIFFSDSAAHQYKNCFNMINLTYHKEDFQLDVEWHFFATSHGKGPSDGLGGQFKRNATRESIQGTIIRTPQELYQ